MNKEMDVAGFGIDCRRLADLMTCLRLVTSWQRSIQEITNNMETFGAKIGLGINCEKTKAMKIGPEQLPPMLIMQQNVCYIEKFP